MNRARLSGDLNVQPFLLYTEYRSKTNNIETFSQMFVDEFLVIDNN